MLRIRVMPSVQSGSEKCGDQAEDVERGWWKLVMSASTPPEFTGRMNEDARFADAGRVAGERRGMSGKKIFDAAHGGGPDRDSPPGEWWKQGVLSRRR